MARRAAGWVLIAAGLAMLGVVTRAQSSLGTDVAIEDRSARALDALHTALRETEQQRGRTRLVFWGASHTASDQYTGPLRDEWQRRFGDAGPGLVLPVQAFSLYAHREVRVAPVGAWHVVRVRGTDRATSAYGPHGIAIEADGAADAWIELVPGVPAVDEAAIHFLRQPGGGTIEVRTPGNASQRIRTRGEGPDSVVIRASIQRVELRALGDGPVRLFGVSLERTAPGVIVDGLGIPGARMRDRLPWDDRALRAQLAELAPDLIVLAYGTNESGGGGPIAREARAIDEAVRRARALAPDASCVLIGPSDWPLRQGDGTWLARPRTAEIAALQRESAARRGCGYFDLVRFMGGPASMPRWVDAGLALDDYVHFTDDGYQRMARALSRALLRGYRSDR